MPQFVKEQIEYREIDHLPRGWRPYFKESNTGKIYTVIRKIIDLSQRGDNCSTCGSNINDYVASNTEFQTSLNNSLYEACLNYKKPKVLVVGYGLGLFLSYLESIEAQLTILEKYEQILDLDPNIGVVRFKHRVIVGDHNKIDLDVLESGYDIIFVQINEQLRIRTKEMRSILSESGICIYV